MPAFSYRVTHTISWKSVSRGEQLQSAQRCRALRPNETFIADRKQRKGPIPAYKVVRTVLEGRVQHQRRAVPRRTPATERERKGADRNWNKSVLLKSEPCNEMLLFFRLQLNTGNWPIETQKKDERLLWGFRGCVWVGVKEDCCWYTRNIKSAVDDLTLSWLHSVGALLHGFKAQTQELVSWPASAGFCYGGIGERDSLDVADYQPVLNLYWEINLRKDLTVQTIDQFDLHIWGEGLFHKMRSGSSQYRVLPSGGSQKMRWASWSNIQYLHGRSKHISS